MSKVIEKYGIELFLNTKVKLTEEEIEKFIKDIEIYGVESIKLKRKNSKMNIYTGQTSSGEFAKRCCGYLVRTVATVTKDEFIQFFNESEYEDEDDNVVTYEQIKDDEDWEDIINDCIYEIALDKAIKVKNSLRKYAENIKIAKFTEEDKQAYLMRLVRRAEEELKKKALPRKHERFINISGIKFSWFDYEEIGKDSTLGQYFADEYGENAKIYVNIRCFNEHILNNNIKFLDKDIIKTLQHEMIHHYVNCKYNLFDYGFERDSSPIFLAYLQWFGILESGHKSSVAFKRTKLYKEVNECKTFDELERLTIDYAIDYRMKFRDLEEVNTKDGLFKNTFIFGNGDVIGLTKQIVGYVDDITKLEEKISIIDNTFRVGSCVMPEDIDRLYNRKKYNLNAESVYNFSYRAFVEIEKNPEAYKRYNFDNKTYKIVKFKSIRHEKEKFGWHK